MALPEKPARERLKRWIHGHQGEHGQLSLGCKQTIKGVAVGHGVAACMEAVLQGDRPAQGLRNRTAAKTLQPCLGNRLHPGLGGTIEQRDLITLHQQGHGSEAHARQGCQQVLHRGQAALVQLQSGAELCFADLTGLQQLQRLLRRIEPAHPEARLLTGLKPHPRHATAVQAHTAALHGRG